MEAHSNQTFNVVTPFYTRAMILRAWRAVLSEQRMRIRFAAGHCRNVPSRVGSAFSLGCFAPSSRGAWINRGVTGRIAAPSTFLSSESINSRRDVRGDGRRIRHRYLSFAPGVSGLDSGARPAGSLARAGRRRGDRSAVGGLSRLARRRARTGRSVPTLVQTTKIRFGVAPRNRSASNLRKSDLNMRCAFQFYDPGQTRLFVILAREHGHERRRAWPIHRHGAGDDRRNGGSRAGIPRWPWS